MKPVVAVLGAPGTNRHHDMAFAFEQAGAEPVHVDVTDLPERADVVAGAQIVAVAGGFSYADALGSGRVFAQELMARAGDLLTERVTAGVPVIGVCNGFQVLVRTGLLPGAALGTAALAHNAGGAFVCRWVSLAPVSRHSMWTAGVDGPITCPVAHGEGRFLVEPTTLARLQAADAVALRYVTPDGAPAGGAEPWNPNGSVDDIAGVCDASGLVLGLMPHPENHVTARQGRSGSPTGTAGLALAMFENGVRHVRGA